MKTNSSIIIFIFMIITGCNRFTGPESGNYPDIQAIKGGYPHLAMWWPDTWEQPLDELKRYDWIGFGEWDHISAIEKLKTLNPDQKHFMDYSITETSWSEWQNNTAVMEKIPSEWFLTQHGTLLAQPLDANQSTVFVESVADGQGNALFQIDDNITCEYETMKVRGINVQDNTLVVERGFVREAASHARGARIAPHITFWPKTWVMNMSSLCPKVDIGDGNGPQNWIDFATRYFDVENKDLWDGFIVDRIEDEQSWLIPEWCRSIDPDCSNQEIIDGYITFDAAWNEGCVGFLEHLRTELSGKALISNTSGAYYELLNGAIYEGFPGNWTNDRPETYQEWAGRALGENGYINVSKSGYTPNYSLAETYEDEEMPDDDGSYDNPYDNPGFVPDYQKMRYGLTTALLGNGYFSYEISTAGHGSLGLMWFDEYDNAGKGRGYLGQPEESAYKVMDAGDGSVWRREFENGTIICNPTNAEVTVDLGATYWLIDGEQVPDINSGKSVKKITVGARDGRILLKESHY